MKHVTGNQNAASAEMLFELKWVAIPRKSQEHDFVWYNSWVDDVNVCFFVQYLYLLNFEVVGRDTKQYFLLLYLT